MAANDSAGEDKTERYLRVDHVQTDLGGRTVRGGTLTVSAELVRQALWLIAGIAIARVLTPQEIGLVAMVIVITGFVDLFNDLGLSAATIQRAELHQRQVSGLFWINMTLGIGLALITTSLAPAIAWFYGDPRLVWITIAISSGFVFSGMGVQHRALLRRQMRFTPLAMIDILSAIVGVAAGIGTAVAGFGYWSLVWMRVAAAPLELVALWLSCRWRPDRPSRASNVRSLVQFGANLTGYRLLTYLARNVDNLLLGRFYGPHQLGLYSRAYSLLLLPIQAINNPIASVAVSSLSRLADTPARYRETYTNIAGKVCMLCMPMVVLMIGAADWLILFLLGPQWSDASRIFMWLGLSGLIEPFSYTVIWLFVTQGRARQQFRWGLVSATLIVGAIVCGLPWGAVGVAAAYGLTSLCVRMPLLFWFAGREGAVRTSDLVRTLAPFAGAACISLACLFGFRYLVPDLRPLSGIIVATGLTASTWIATLAVLPAGRSALTDLRQLPALLMKREVAT
jgi:O-antigen/teichoic acid export membrane protein